MRSNIIQLKRRGRRAALGLSLGLSLGALSACDSLLEVELPHLLTEAALEGPETAETQVNSIIALFECGSSAFGMVSLGHEDVIESIAGVGSSNSRYRNTPDTGGQCDDGSSNGNWFDQIMGARAAASNSVERGDITGTGVYDRIQNDETWSSLRGTAEGERLSAITAIYLGAIFTHYGEFYCEMAFDGGPLVKPDEALVTAENWINLALNTHIGADFAMPFGISTSAVAMATALRARIRWARGDLAGAATDAATITDGFTAWITRESGEQRRNKIFHYHRSISFGGMYGVIDWWDPEIRSDKPGGGKWANPIPFTGYIFLGIMPDGRTIDASGNAVLWAEEIRDADENPIPLPGFSSADADTRVAHVFKTIQGPDKREAPDRYTAENDDIPLVSWKEMRLIQAEQANATGDQAGAIAHVNALRTDAGVQIITSGGAYEAALLASQVQTRMMILEERRRAFFAEAGRYWSTKIQNTDLLWFPRNEGSTPGVGYSLFGGVRLQFPDDEYEQNENFQPGGLDLIGTGCDPDQRPHRT